MFSADTGDSSAAIAAKRSEALLEENHILSAELFDGVYVVVCDFVRPAGSLGGDEKRWVGLEWSRGVVGR